MAIYSTDFRGSTGGVDSNLLEGIIDDMPVYWDTATATSTTSYTPGSLNTYSAINSLTLTITNSKADFLYTFFFSVNAYVDTASTRWAFLPYKDSVQQAVWGPPGSWANTGSTFLKGHFGHFQTNGTGSNMTVDIRWAQGVGTLGTITGLARTLTVVGRPSLT